MAKIEGIAHSEYWDDEDEVLIPESFAVHPGPFFKRHVLTEKNITTAALADHLMVARPGLNNMLNGKRPVTTPLALKLERATGYPAAILCQMQATYDLAHDRAELVEQILEIKPMLVAA